MDGFAGMLIARLWYMPFGEILYTTYRLYR